MAADQNQETMLYETGPVVAEVPAEPTLGSQPSYLLDLYASIAGDRYLVTEQVALGALGLSEIYRVTDWKDRAAGSVALKVFHEPYDAVSRRVDREIQAHLLLDGEPGIASFRDAGVLEEDGQEYRYLATRFAEGGTLGDHIKRGSRDVELIQNMATQILPALGAMHERGIIHRDVKPGNILVDGAEERFELTDFGIVSLAGAADTSEETPAAMEMPSGTVIKVSADRLLGTVGFIAPEAFNVNEPVGPEVDVFAMGVVLFRGMTGRLPFSSRHIYEYRDSVTEESPVSVHELNRAVPAVLEELTMESLRRDPRDRPRIDELEARLQTV